MTVGIHLLGRKPDPPDAHDFAFRSLVTAQPVLPAHYVSAPSPVLDQGDTPHCVGFSGALMRSIEERRDEKHRLAFDGDDLYAGAKRIDGAPNEDGTDIRSACKVLLADGALVSGSTIATEVGQRRKIAAYARLYTIEDIKRAIFLYGSAWLGSSWANSWFEPGHNGTLPPPDSSAGGHAYDAVGWSDRRQALRCQNSWTIEWAQHGRFWLPYEYVDFTDFDCWRTIDVLGDA